MSLEIHNLSKRYGKNMIFADANCSFDTGLTLLTGPSGAGKSTLLRILATAETAQKGDVVWNGQKMPKARNAFRRVLGYSPQSVDFPEDLTGREFGQHIAALKGLERKASDEQFLWLCDQLNLHGDIGRPIASYSGGMRRRLTVAQCFLGKPEFIALDEPTAELDAGNADAVHSLIHDAAQNAIIVMTTHLAEHLRSHITQELTVANGRIVKADMP